jgi:hypothetical protein
VSGDAQVRSTARVAVALLCAGALVATIAVLGGSDRDGSKALFVATALAGFSLTGAAGLRLATRGPEVVTYVFGYLTIALSAIAFGEAVAAFWSADWLYGNGGKTAAQVAMATIGAANISLLLSTERVEDGIEVHGARVGAVLSILLLTVLALIESSDPGSDIGIKPMALCAILYVLCAALITLLRRADFAQR